MSKTSKEDNSIDFINKCLEVSNDNDILLEVVYTAFIEANLSKNIDEAFQKSLWYWLLFKAKKPHKVDINALQKKLKDIQDEYSQ